MRMRKSSRFLPRGDFATGQMPVGGRLNQLMRSRCWLLIMGRFQKKGLQKNSESELGNSSKYSGSEGEIINGRIQKRSKLKKTRRKVNGKEGVACLGDQSCDTSTHPSPDSAMENSKVLTNGCCRHLSATLDHSVRTVVSMDCEMVGVGNRSVLAKCSILDYNGQVLYNEYIRPSKPISDYRTKWSGIKPHHMKGAQPFGKAIQTIKQTLKGNIIVGHDLVHDFAVIGLQHPRTSVRDTAKFVPLRGLAGLEHTLSPSLKNLTANLLGRSIQNGSHCSLEDARAALDIYRKYESAWEEHLLDKTFWLQDQFWPEDICYLG